MIIRYLKILGWFLALGVPGGPVAATSVAAATLERGGDGRVIIRAFGERVAFREKDASNVYFWWDRHCDPADSLGTTLERWLHDPKIAECLNDSIPTEVADISRPSENVVFQVTLAVEEGYAYPGAVKVSELAKSSLGPISVSVLLHHPELKHDCVTYDAPLKGIINGFESYMIMVAPPVFEFLRKPSDRIDPLSRPLCIICRTINATECYVHLHSDDRLVGLFLRWQQGEKYSPQAEWLTYDRTARDIAHAIFIDRPKQDLQ